MVDWLAGWHGSGMLPPTKLGTKFNFAKKQRIGMQVANVIIVDIIVSSLAVCHQIGGLAALKCVPCQPASPTQGLSV